MPFLGRTPGVEPRSTVFKQDVTPDGTSTDYTLDHASTANGLAVFVNNVRQEPGDAYTVSGTTLTFTSVPDSADNIYIVFQSPVLASREVVVGADTVNTASIQDGAITAAKLATSVDTHDSAAVQAQIDSAAVTLTGNQTISGIKTFSDSAQFNTHVHISGPRGGNGSDGIYDAALSLTASNQTTLSVMNDSDGFANLNLGSVDPLGDGSNKSNFWHISYRNLSSHSNKLQNFWYDSSGFDGPMTSLTTDGDFGIGVADPDAKLHVNGSFRQTGATAPFEWTVNPGASDYYKLNAVGYSDNLIVANASGQVGLQTTTMSARLNVGANGSTDRNSINIGTNYPSGGTKTGIITWRDGANVVGQLDTSYDGNSVRMNIGSLYQTGYNTDDIMRIDPRGITMPKQPAFSAYLNTNQSPYAVNDIVAFDAEHWDNASNFNTSNGYFTAPVTGRYLLIANCLIGNASTGDHFEIVLNTSNRGYYGGMPGRIEYQNGTSWGDGYISLGIAQIVDMDVNDVANVYFSTFGGGYIYGSGWSKFSGYLLG